MDKTVLAVRAITAEYIKQWLLPFLFAGIGVYAVVMGVVAWIASIASAWWWLLAVVPSIVFLLALALWVFVRVLAGRISPPLSKQQKRAVKRFNQKINDVAEKIATPKFVIVYRVIKDVITRPTSSKTFIGEIAQEPGEMRKAFDDLRNSF